MGNILIISGSVITFFSIISIILKKRRRFDVSEYMGVDLEYRDLKNDIMDLRHEFDKSALEHKKSLEQKYDEVNLLKELLDKKIIEYVSLIKEYEEKANIIKNDLNSLINTGENVLNQNLNNKTVYDEKEKEEIKTKVYSLYKSGKNIRQISEELNIEVNTINMIMGINE